MGCEYVISRTGHLPFTCGNPECAPWTDDDKRIISYLCEEHRAFVQLGCDRAYKHTDAPE